MSAPVGAEAGDVTLGLNLTLRDWFAGQAMERFKFGGYARDGVEAVRAAEAAYRIADHMLAARGLSPEELAARAKADTATPGWRKP